MICNLVRLVRRFKKFVECFSFLSLFFSLFGSEVAVAGEGRELKRSDEDLRAREY